MGGAIRADWHLAELDALDVAAAGAEIAELQSVATVIDLSKSEAELTEEFRALVREEGLYAARATDEHGAPLECRLKWQDHHLLMSEKGTLSCYGCPHHTADRREARSVLCALGRRQEDVLETIRGVRLADSLEAELAAAFARDIDACAELAAAQVLTPA